LTDVQIPKWCKPSEARDIVGEDVWRRAQKIVVVRLPVDRFVTGISLSLSVTLETLREAGASEGFVEFIESIRDVSSWVRGRLAVKFLSDKNLREHAPLWMHPQKDWLSAKFDTVIATHDIAEYLTTNKIGVNRPKRLNYGLNKVILEKSEMKKFREIYPDDEATFSSLMVWSPKSKSVRLVTGYCTACTEKAKGFPIDLTVPDVQPEVAPSEPNAISEGTPEEVANPSEFEPEESEVTDGVLDVVVVKPSRRKRTRQ